MISNFFARIKFSSGSWDPKSGDGIRISGWAIGKKLSRKELKANKFNISKRDINRYVFRKSS
jgi:hypothetical protein